MKIERPLRPKWKVLHTEPGFERFDPDDASELEHWAKRVQGLAPLSEDESERFFGQEDRIRELVNKLAHTRFVAVIGQSGCGKSSLVHRDYWRRCATAGVGALES